MAAADFPGDGAQRAFAGGDEEGVQGAAVALHLFVGGHLRFRGRDARQCRRMGQGDYEHVGGEGESGVGVRGAERSFCRGDVGVFCDGGDEMGCEVGV